MFDKSIKNGQYRSILFHIEKTLFKLSTSAKIVCGNMMKDCDFAVYKTIRQIRFILTGVEN